MRAAIFKGANNIELEEYPLRKLAEEEILIEVANCGVCGTDMHIFEGKAHAKTPVILGHEYSGIVVEKSSNHSELKIGDKVTVNPNIHCGYCDACRKGKINLCKNLKALGVTKNGGFAEYSIVPFSQAYQVPHNFDLSEAAFAEPLSCCIHGINLAVIKFGEKIAVIGGGTIGQLMIQLAKLAGAGKIILIEPVETKRNLGLELGADEALDPGDDRFYKKFEHFMQSSADVIIECVGGEKTADLALKLAGKGSRILIFGLAPKYHKAELDLQYLFQNEIQIINSLLNPFTFSTAVELLISKKINVKKLLSRKTELKKINEIFHQGKDTQIIKDQIIINSKEAV